MTPWVIAVVVLSMGGCSVPAPRPYMSDWHRCTTYREIPADWITRCQS